MFQEIRMWVWGVCVCVCVCVCVTSVLKTYTLLFRKARSKHWAAFQCNRKFTTLKKKIPFEEVIK